MTRTHPRTRKVRRRRLQRPRLRWLLLVALALAVVDEYLPTPPRVAMLTQAEMP